jgi:hypothetical protein
MILDMIFMKWNHSKLILTEYYYYYYYLLQLGFHPVAVV